MRSESHCRRQACSPKRPGNAHVYQPHGLLRRAAGGPGDARGRDSHIHTQDAAHAAGHGGGHLGADGSVGDQQFLRHAQHVAFDLVGIGDHAPQVKGRAARKVGDQVAHQAAGTRFGAPQCPAAGGQLRPDACHTRLVVGHLSPRSEGADALRMKPIIPGPQLAPSAADGLAGVDVGADHDIIAAVAYEKAVTETSSREEAP